MSRIETHTGTLSVNPSGYIRVEAYSLSNMGNAYDDETSTTYAMIRLTRGTEGAVTDVYFTFDTSNIPANATILSVECRAKVYCNTSMGTRLSVRTVQMCSGTTPKGAAQSATTTVGVRTFDDATWTREELNDTRIRFYAERGTTNLTSDYYFRCYGATLEVEYSYQETIYTVTSSSNISGVTVTPTSQEYSSGDSATVTISGASSNILVSDNNVDVTNQIVASGSDYTYTIASVSEDHTIIVAAPPAPLQTIYFKQNGTWVTVSELYIKLNGSWVAADMVYIKNNGNWNN